MWDRVRRNFADALGLYLLPGLACLLPWPVAFALLKRVSRSERLYRDGVDAAWYAARQFVDPLDEARFRQRFRLLRLVDLADAYLTMLRTDRWWRRHVDIDGVLPPPGARVLLTYHWGAGTWLWPLLRAHGLAAHFLVRRAQAVDVGASRAAGWFAAWRAWALRRIGSRGPIYTGGASDDVVAALRDGHCIVGMLDLPARAQQNAIELPLLGRRARIPIGLAQLARRVPVPVSCVSVGLDFDDGRRRLRTFDVADDSPAEHIAEAYLAHLDQRLREEPEAWQLWCVAPEMFVRDDATATQT